MIGFSSKLVYVYKLLLGGARAATLTCKVVHDECLLDPFVLQLIVSIET
jgi:hypothetical protein